MECGSRGKLDELIPRKDAKNRKGYFCFAALQTLHLCVK